tara:strand:+ start:148 stop:690 length:543 start_codon:yes stop_codon:yes gene_type:complete
VKTIVLYLQREIFAQGALIPAQNYILVINSKMKSTKIEDLIDEGDDSIDAIVEEDINNLTNMNSEINSAPAHEASDELKAQLVNIQNELSDMRNKDSETAQAQPILERDQIEKSFSDIFKIQPTDFKKLVVLSILYGIISSPYIGDVIDNMIPYSLYNYAFIIKLIIFILLYRVLDFFAN